MIRPFSRYILPTIAAVSIVANLILKQEVINELHDRHCCSNGVIFSDFGSVKMISSWTANSYHITSWVFIGSMLAIIVTEYLYRRL